MSDFNMPALLNSMPLTPYVDEHGARRFTRAPGNSVARELQELQSLVASLPCPMTPALEQGTTDE